MEALVVLTLVCGQAVSAIIGLPMPDGTRQVIVAELDATNRDAVLAEIEKLKDSGAQVHVVRGEKNADGVTCRVRT